MDIGKISKHIDWIGATFPDLTTPQMALPLFDWHRVGEGPHGQPNRHVCGITGAIFDSGARSEQGSHLELGGSALSAMRIEWNCTDSEIMANLAQMKGRLSRIDLAINLYDCKLTPALCSEAFEENEIKTSARTGRLMHEFANGQSGDTFYMGNRTSDRYVRIYDKNAEQHITNGAAWIRLEMEIKRMKARATQHAMAEHTVPAVINGQFDSYMKWGNREFNAAISGDSAEIEETGRKETNAEKWLMEQVAKTLARVSHVRPGFRSEFDKRVDFHMSELSR